MVSHDPVSPSAANPPSPYPFAWVESMLREPDRLEPSRRWRAGWVADAAAWQAIADWVRASPLEALRDTMPAAFGGLLSPPPHHEVRREDQDALLEAVLDHWGLPAWDTMDLQSALQSRIDAPEFPRLRAPLLVALLRYMNRMSAEWARRLVVRVLAERDLSADDLDRLCTIPWRAPVVWSDLTDRLRAAAWPEPATTAIVVALGQLRPSAWSDEDVPALVETCERLGAPRGGAALLRASTHGLAQPAPPSPVLPSRRPAPEVMLAVWAGLSAAWWAAVPTPVLVGVLHHPVGALRLLAIQRVGDRGRLPALCEAGIVRGSSEQVAGLDTARSAGTRGNVHR